MDMFKMIKEAAAMKSRLTELEKKLKSTMFTTEHNGVKVTTNGKADLINLEISAELISRGQKDIEQSTLSAIQLASKKAHDMLSEETKKLTGGLSIPGLN
jgi:DNA-binding protein YbaB